MATIVRICISFFRLFHLMGQQDKRKTESKQQHNRERDKKSYLTTESQNLLMFSLLIQFFLRK